MTTPTEDADLTIHTAAAMMCAAVDEASGGRHLPERRDTEGPCALCVERMTRVFAQTARMREQMRRYFAARDGAA